MRKAICILIPAILLASVICGCGRHGSSSSSVFGFGKATGEPTREPYSISTPAPVETEAPVVTEAPADPFDDETEVYGVSSGDQYYSEALGLGFLSEDWEFYDGDTLSSRFSQPASVKVKDLEKLFNEYYSLTIMMGNETAGRGSFNVQLSPLTSDEYSMAESDPEAYIDFSLEGCRQAFEEMSFDGYEVKKDHATVFDSSVPCVYSEGWYEDFVIYQKQVYLLYKGCAVVITATSTSYKEFCDDILALFFSR